MEVKNIRESFEIIQNPQLVPGMEAYMKGNFEYYGIRSTDRKEMQKLIFPDIKHLKGTKAGWDLIFDLWNESKRELHYFAIDWLNSWKKNHLKENDWVHLEKLLSKNAWWDSVDAIASNFLGVWCKAFPEKRDEVIANWRNMENKWLRRSCIIFQLKYKDETDFELLKSLAVENKNDKEFFIQKAIGWSLRQYSRFNSIGVYNFVVEQDFKGLARREAIRLIEK